MKNGRKTIALAMAAAMSLGLCASAYAETTVSVTDNGSTLEETSNQTSEAPSEAPTLEGAVLDVKKADIPVKTVKSGTGQQNKPCPAFECLFIAF